MRRRIAIAGRSRSTSAAHDADSGSQASRIRSDFADCAWARWTARSCDVRCERGGECHRAHCHAGRGQPPPLRGLHHWTDRARGRAGTAQFLKKTSDGNFQLAQVCRYRSESLNVCRCNRCGEVDTDRHITTAATCWNVCSPQVTSPFLFLCLFPQFPPPFPGPPDWGALLFGPVCGLFWPLRIRIQRSSRENQGRLKDGGRVRGYRPTIKYDDSFEESANVIKFASP